MKNDRTRKIFLVMLLVLLGTQFLGLGFLSEQIASLRETLRERTGETSLSPADRGETDAPGTPPGPERAGSLRQGC